MFGESGRERERGLGEDSQVMEVGLTGGAEGGTWHPDSTRMTRTRDALMDRPRVRSGPSADG